MGDGNIYDRSEREELVEEGDLSPEMEGFMLGYDEAEDE